MVINDMRYFSIILIFATTLHSCSNKSTKYKEGSTTYKSSAWVIQTEKFVVNSIRPINETALETLQYSDGYYCYYNSNTDCIEMIASDSSLQNFEIALNTNKEEGEVTSIYIQGRDTIVVIQEYAISFYSTTSGLFKQYFLNIADSTQYFYGRFSMGYFPIIKNGKLYLERLSLDCALNRNCANSAKEVVFDLHSEMIDTVAIFPSKLYLNNFADMTSMSRVSAGELLIYSFQIDPNLYVYNETNKNCIVVGGRSKHQKNDALSLNPYATSDSVLSYRQQVELIVALPQYTAMCYNAQTNRLYRLFFREVEYRNARGFYNTYRDKEVYLMVFDKEFNVVDEIPVKGNCATYKLLPVEKAVGLILGSDSTSITIEKIYHHEVK